MLFSHSAQLLDPFPQLSVATLSVTGVTAAPDVVDITRPFLERATARLAERPESGFPEITAWRRAFSQMGLKPTQDRGVGGVTGPVSEGRLATVDPSAGRRVQRKLPRLRDSRRRARHPDGRYLIEAKAEGGKNGPQQVNYFVGMLGELVQRMDDVQASYGIALPDNRQYRGLVNRLPALAKERLRLAVFWVSRECDELIVEVES
jgi:hypothetical protein